MMCQGSSRLELDVPGDVDHAGLAGFAGGEVVGLFGLAGARPVRAVADEEARARGFSEEGRQHQVKLMRGGKAVIVSVAAAAVNSCIAKSSQISR